MEAKQEIEKQKKYIEKVKKINNNKKLKYNIYTMGCQLNENDSEKLCGMIEDMGYEIIKEKVYKTNKHVFIQLCGE